VRHAQKAVVFIRDFYQCPGFAQVVGDFARGQTKNKGAKFVMEFVTDSANKIDPRLAKFEQPVGITKGRLRGGAVKESMKLTLPPRCWGIMGFLKNNLSLSQIKSEHIGGVARREPGDKECVRPVRWRARPARPCPYRKLNLVGERRRIG
jgi:hypothetical protein